jgi:hypothetical protein
MNEMTSKKPAIHVKLFSGKKKPLKCLACKRKRTKPTTDDGWLYYAKAAVCGYCRAAAATKGLQAQAQLEAMVVAIGDSNREKMVARMKTKDYEVFDCERCGAPAGKFCKSNCSAHVENNIKARREVQGGGGNYRPMGS